MPTVTVYRFTTYDGRSEEKLHSTRYGTLKGIKAIGGDPLVGTAVEVEASVVGSEIEGLTERAFDPGPRMPDVQPGSPAFLA